MSTHRLLGNELLRIGGTVPWWTVTGVTCVAAYQPKGAASLAASYVNLANPGTNDAAPGTAPTFNAATGWGFNAASSQYLTTGIVPPNTATWSVLVQFSGGSGDGAIILGQLTGTTRLFLQPISGTNRVYSNGATAGSGTAIAGAVTAGNLAMAGTRAYLDGIDVGGLLNNGTGTAYSIYIGAANRDFVGNPWSGNIQALAIYSATLTGPQVATLYAAMAAL